MNHPTEDELLLLAYSELAESRAAVLESHVAACAACREQLTQLERARVGLQVALAPTARRRRRVWVAFAVAAAAVLAGIVITRSAPSRDSDACWTPTTTWSATAGYVTGGKAMMDIDAQLTRLERERYYGLPN